MSVRVVLVTPELRCVSDLWWHWWTYSSLRQTGTEEEAVEDLVMLEQMDKGTWKSRDGVDCEKAKQISIDMKYEDGGY